MTDLANKEAPIYNFHLQNLAINPKISLCFGNMTERYMGNINFDLHLPKYLANPSTTVLDS